MQASGLNSIEYVLHFLLSLWKIASWTLLVLIVAPVLYLLWSWNTMSAQAEAVRVLNQVGGQSLSIDFNRCLMIAHSEPNYPKLPFDATVSQVAPAETRAFLQANLPWAPALVDDPAHPRMDFDPEPTSRGAYEGMYLDHYRRSHDIPHADPWYYHGLFKLAPTLKWDTGTGPDYAFGKVAGNYQAYVGAARAVASVRYVLGARALGISPGDLSAAASGLDNPQLQAPAVAFAALHRSQPGNLERFLKAYNTDFGTQLPVVSLDLQKFNPPQWQNVSGGHMDWWGGPGAGGGGQVDNGRDFFITGLRTMAQTILANKEPVGRPSFTAYDFLFNHLPEVPADVARARSTLLALTTDAFWDKVLPDSKTRDAAHDLLYTVRKDLEVDTYFSRRYGYILFSGDKFGRDKSVMQ